VKLCPCGCGKELLPYNGKPTMVCYRTWQRVDPDDRRAIMMPGAKYGARLKAARTAAFRVYRLAHQIRLDRTRQTLFPINELIL